MPSLGPTHGTASDDGDGPCCAARGRRLWDVMLSESDALVISVPSSQMSLKRIVKCKRGATQGGKDGGLGTSCKERADVNGTMAIRTYNAANGKVPKCARGPASALMA